MVRFGLIISLVLFFWRLDLSATTVYPYTMDQMIQMADIIIMGEVSSAQGAVTVDNFVYTKVKIRVEKRLKGSCSGEIIVRRLGGTYMGRIVKYHGVPDFRPGEKVFLLLKRANSSGEYDTISLKLSKFTVYRNKANVTHIRRDIDGIAFVRGPGRLELAQKEFPLADISRRISLKKINSQ